MTVRPALAGAAILALLLTGCAGASAPGNGRTDAAGSTSETTPMATPEPTVTPEPTGTPEPTPTGDPVPAVTSIVLHPRTIDFLAADGTTVDSTALVDSPDDAAELITEARGTAPTVEEATEERGFCGLPTTYSTWPGGIILIARPDGSPWWRDIAAYFVRLEGSGHNGVTFQTAGGYTVGEVVTEDAGVPGTMRTLESEDKSIQQRFISELGAPDPGEYDAWGVVAYGHDWVIDEIWAPNELDHGRC